MRSVLIVVMLFSFRLAAQEAIFGGKSYEFNAKRFGFLLQVGVPGDAQGPAGASAIGETGFGLGVLLQQYRFKLGYRVMPNIAFLGRRLVLLQGSPRPKRVIETTWFTLPVSGMLRTDPTRGWWLYFPAGFQYSCDFSSKLNNFGTHGGVGLTKILPYFELSAELRGQYVLAETKVPAWRLEKGSVFFSLIFSG